MLLQCLTLDGLAAPSSDTPKLSIARAEDGLVLSWPDWATNWVLEESSHLRTPIPWRRVASSESDLRINPSVGTNGFFRLRKLSENSAGLSGHWQFDAGDGTSSEAGPIVFFTNAIWATGRVGPQSLHFDGAISGTKAWVSNTNYRVLPGASQPFSISMWLSPDALPIGSQGLIGNANWNVSLQTTSPGTNNLVLSAPSLNVTAQTLLVPHEWHELTVTYDGSHGNVYLDGNLLARAPGPITTDQHLIYFGGGIGAYNSFLGRIDEVRTYTNALTAEQLSLTGHWRMDETTGTVLQDSSIYGHHGRTTEIVSSTGKVGRSVQITSNAITIANSDFLVLPPSGAPFSISFWMFPNSSPSGRTGLMSFGNGTNASWEMTLETAGAETAMSLKSSPGIGTLNMRTPCTLPISQWSKVDVTFNGAVATIYLNGRKLLHDSGVIQSGRDWLRIGYVPGAATFNGLIDELETYRRERGESEIGPVATIMWETVFRGAATNFTLQGAGPAGKTLTYSILNNITSTNGTITQLGTSSTITYQAGPRKGPDALMFTVSDGEFTSVPATLNLSIVEPHWLAPDGGTIQPLDGSSPDRAWRAPNTAALDAIWRTNNYYDCFYYAPGVYETSGARYATRPTAFAGCKHIGSGFEGPQSTTLKLVGALEAWSEEVIFAKPYAGAFVDGFEAHNMLLDCNANNNPKFTRGEPVWIKLPLTGTSLVHSLTIRWNNGSNPGIGFPWRVGAAQDFRVCTRILTTNGFVTNCLSLSTTGEVDVVALESVTDEVTLYLEHRAASIEFYSISELELNGGQVKLPSATHSGSIESRLDPNLPDHSALRLVDQNPGTFWASGVETNVHVSIPVDASAPIDSLMLHWNCSLLPTGLQLGPASEYKIRARRMATGEYEYLVFTRAPRTPEGLETNSFARPINTDELVIELMDREADVNAYSLREVSVYRSGISVPLAIPAALTELPINGDNSVFQALDNAPETAWTCSIQGMIGAVDMVGNNLKFTRLKVVGFGTRPGRECFPFFINNPHSTKPVGNILVEDCIFTEPATNNPVAEGITSVVLVGNGGSITNNAIRRCTVRDLWPAFPLNAHAFGATTIENCVIENCSEGVYFEPDSVVDYLGPITIRSNRFLNVTTGVLVRFWPARQFGSILMSANEIALVPGRRGWAFVSLDAHPVGPSASITNAAFLNNVVRYSDWLPRPGSIEGGLHYSDIRNALFLNNLITLGTSSSLRVRFCPLGGPLVHQSPQRCPPHPPVEPPPTEDGPACLNALPIGYRRAWLNNRDGSGNLIRVAFQNNGVDGPAFQQQPPTEIP